MSASLQSVSTSLSANCRALTPAPLFNEPKFVRYINAVDAIVAEAGEGIAAKVAEQVRELVANPDWLPQECCEPGDECYKRHLLYADPEGRYTVLALVWQHGQGSPVHGHTAWCSVGVYDGELTAAAYCCEQGPEPVQTCLHRCEAGQVDSIEEGSENPHRIFNNSNKIAISIHTYGRDLVDDPCSINILY